MVHEWQRVVKHCREKPTKDSMDVGYRMSEVNFFEKNKKDQIPPS